MLPPSFKQSFGLQLPPWVTEYIPATEKQSTAAASWYPGPLAIHPPVHFRGKKETSMTDLRLFNIAPRCIDHFPHCLDLWFHSKGIIKIGPSPYMPAKAMPVWPRTILICLVQNPDTTQPPRVQKGTGGGDGYRTLWPLPRLLFKGSFPRCHP